MKCNSYGVTLHEGVTFTISGYLMAPAGRMKKGVGLEDHEGKAPDQPPSLIDLAFVDGTIILDLDNYSRCSIV